MNTVFKYNDVDYRVTRRGTSDEIRFDDLGRHLQGHFQGQR